MFNVINKISVIILIIVFAISPAKSENTGLYAGTALSYISLNGKNSLHVSTKFLNFDLSQSFHMPISDRNLGGEVFFGYERYINDFCLGLEIKGSLTSLKSESKLDITDLGNKQNLSLQTKRGFSGLITAGYRANLVYKFYLNCGLEKRMFRIRFEDSGTSKLLSINKTYNATGFVSGIGLERFLRSNLSLRTEYRISLFPKKSFQTSDLDSKMTVIQARPIIHHFSVGLIYKL